MDSVNRKAKWKYYRLNICPIYNPDKMEANNLYATRNINLNTEDFLFKAQELSYRYK